MAKNHSISVSAPCKVHLLGEHAVVYGKPAILTSVNLRVIVIISSSSRVIPTNVGIQLTDTFKKIIEPIIKKHLKLKKLPFYQIEINSEAPVGAGLGSSAAISASYIAALLSFLKIKWDLNLIFNLTFEAEKVFHGNPSGGDPATVIFGGLIWFRKENPDLKLIQPLNFIIPQKLAKNFVIINTGTPKETTKEMVGMVGARVKSQESRVKRIFDDQERLVKELLPVLKMGNEKELIRIIREGENNLENLGVCSPYATSIIRNIEQSGGAAKICGGGGKTGPVGVLLCYYPNPSVIKDIAKSYNLSYFKAKLGVDGLRLEK